MVALYLFVVNEADIPRWTSCCPNDRKWFTKLSGVHWVWFWVLIHINSKVYIYIYRFASYIYTACEWIWNETTTKHFLESNQITIKYIITFGNLRCHSPHSVDNVINLHIYCIYAKPHICTKWSVALYYRFASNLDAQFSAVAARWHYICDRKIRQIGTGRPEMGWHTHTLLVRCVVNTILTHVSLGSTQAINKLHMPDAMYIMLGRWFVLITHCVCCMSVCLGWRQLNFQYKNGYRSFSLDEENIPPQGA